MKIFGTNVEIKKTHEGTYLHNFNNLGGKPECEVTDESVKNLLENLLTILRRKKCDDKRNAESALGQMARRLYYNVTGSGNDLYTLGYGTTWNFKSIVTDAGLLSKVNDSIAQKNSWCSENQLLKEYNIQEAKTFSATTKVTRTRKPRVATAEVVAETGEVETRVYDVKAVKSAISNLMNFFTEFDFEPNFRFLNTLSRCCGVNKKAAKKYIHNYFALIDSPYVNDVDNKMKSIEFEAALDTLCENVTNKKINNRLEIYYGAQGTGKTTLACEKAENRVIVCNNSMLPADLMQDFDFNDGKATFNSSALYDAMVNGQTIVLDEINLLPFESLRFLQGIVDGKSSIIYKDREVKIADGFKIIGTMNLFVNGMAYALPAPLVDRCENIIEFKLSANDLVGAIC